MGSLQTEVALGEEATKVIMDDEENVSQNTVLQIEQRQLYLVAFSPLSLFVPMSHLVLLVLSLFFRELIPYRSPRLDHWQRSGRTRRATNGSTHSMTIFFFFCFGSGRGESEREKERPIDTHPPHQSDPPTDDVQTNERRAREFLLLLGFLILRPRYFFSLLYFIFSAKTHLLATER